MNDGDNSKNPRKTNYNLQMMQQFITIIFLFSSPSTTYLRPIKQFEMKCEQVELSAFSKCQVFTLFFAINCSAVKWQRKTKRYSSPTSRQTMFFGKAAVLFN